MQTHTRKWEYGINSMPIVQQSDAMHHFNWIIMRLSLFTEGGVALWQLINSSNPVFNFRFAKYHQYHCTKTLWMWSMAQLNKIDSYWNVHVWNPMQHLQHISIVVSHCSDLIPKKSGENHFVKSISFYFFFSKLIVFDTTSSEGKGSDRVQTHTTQKERRKRRSSSQPKR